jgi:HlyD family secretion protein
MSKRKKTIVVVAGLVVILAITGVALGNQRERGVDVRVETVGNRDLVSTVTASGYIQPKRKVDISADISGRVTQLNVEEGQWVNAGDVILRIDPTAYEANVRRATASVAQARAQAAQARANVLRAESELSRAERMGPQNLIAPADVESARTQVIVVSAQMEAAEHGVSQAEAGLTEAEEQLRKTTIAAPMSGQVTRLNIREGETAIVGTMNNAGSLLLTVADLSAMEARVRVGETDIPLITIGDSATIRIDAYPDREFAGTVVRIANSAVNAPSTRASATSSAQSTQAIDFEVIVELDVPPENLRPDLTATADIVTATRKGVVAVPILAVTVRDEEGNKFQAAGTAEPTGDEESEEVEGVFVIRGGKPVWVPVSVGIVGDWYFEVLSGLAVGDSVVSGPYAAVRDLEPNATVRVAAATVTTSAPE